MVEKNPKKKDNLTEKIYQELLRKFQSNELVPGSIIDRKALAEEFNVSMAPVRDALQRLSFEGFVETRSRSATVVRAIQREDIHNMLIMREALESQVSRMICGKIVREHYDELMSKARQVDSSQDPMDYWKADVDFHRHMVSMCNCQLLIETYNQIMNVGNFYQINTFLFNVDPRKRASHTELVDILAEEDKDAAEKALRAHLASGKDTFFSIG